MKLGYLPNPATSVRCHELLLWRKILDRTDDCLHAGEIVVYPGAGYGTTTNPAFAGEIERLWRLDQSLFLSQRHEGL